MSVEKVLGPLGQLTPTYTLLTLGFPLEDESQQASVISTLERAANEIIQAYPWLGGQVVHQASDEEGNSGTYSIASYEPHETSSRFVRVRDCTQLCPSYSVLAKAKAPASMLDGSIICPAYGFINNYPHNVVKPVCIMQANFVQGGLLLTISTFHCVMDANGNEQLIRQFASLCRGEKLSEEYIRWGNADRDTIVPPLKPGQRPLSMEHLRIPSSLGITADPIWPPPPATVPWRTFRITRERVAGLKQEGSELCSPDSDVKYISSNDAVSTFIWLRLSGARLAWLPQDSKSTLIRAVNGRRRLDDPIHEGYMGHLVLCYSVKVPIEEALQEPLSASVIKVRRGLENDINDYAVRSFFHFLQQEKDITTVSYGAGMNIEADLMMTSFAAQKLYHDSFGDILGKPDFVRRPSLPDAPSLLYIMPLTREGDVDFVINLSDREFKGLQADPKWNEFVQFIG